MIGAQGGDDPWIHNDPWLQSSSLTISPNIAPGVSLHGEFSNPYAEAAAIDAAEQRPMSPRRRASSPTGSPPYASPDSQRVDPDDELSDSQAENPSAAPVSGAARDPVDMRAADAPGPVPVRGYTTPVPQVTNEYIGIPVWQRHLQREQRPTPISDSLINRLSSSSQLLAPTRSTEPARRQHLLRHNRPLSSAHSSSFQQTAQLSTEAPRQTSTSMDRIMEVSRLMAANRAEREARRNGFPAAAGSRPETPQAGTPVEPPMAAPQPVQFIPAFPVPQEPVIDPVPMVPEVQPNGPEAVDVAQDLPDPLTGFRTDDFVWYEGADDQCSICQAQFQHHEFVCRLPCRHMFHGSCWDNMRRVATANAPEGRRPHFSCPNCRGDGDMMAAWRYIAAGHGPSYGHAPPERQGRSRRRDTSPLSPRPRSGPPDHIPENQSYLSSNFPIQTNLSDGRPSIIVDPGSVGNLCGDKWAKHVAMLAKKNGHSPSYNARPRPLEVCGVGNGSQSCHYDCTLPIAIQPENASDTNIGDLRVPAVSNSDLPGLLGLTALKKNRAVLDFTTLKLYFCGPNDYELEKGLPEGTDVYQLETAPSGHIVLPCCEYQKASSSSDHSLTLLSRDKRPSSGRESQASTSQHTHSRATASRIPPPPSAAPILPSSAAATARMGTPPAQSA